MSAKPIKTDDYRAFIQDVKQRIQTAQIKAAITVNEALLRLYWDIAASIVAKQKESAWGDGFLVQMSRDLQDEFPDMQGFSLRNLKYMRQWYQFWSAAGAAIGQQLVAQIPFCKSKKKTVVKYALKDLHKPIGVSEYQLTRILPEEFQPSLPSIEEIEAELGSFEVAICDLKG